MKKILMISGLIILALFLVACARQADESAFSGQASGYQNPQKISTDLKIEKEKIKSVKKTFDQEVPKCSQGDKKNEPKEVKEASQPKDPFPSDLPPPKKAVPLSYLSSIESICVDGEFIACGESNDVILGKKRLIFKLDGASTSALCVNKDFVKGKTYQEYATDVITGYWMNCDSERLGMVVNNYLCGYSNNALFWLECSSTSTNSKFSIANGYGIKIGSDYFACMKPSVWAKNPDLNENCLTYSITSSSDTDYDGLKQCKDPDCYGKACNFFDVVSQDFMPGTCINVKNKLSWECAPNKELYCKIKDADFDYDGLKQCNDPDCLGKQCNQGGAYKTCQKDVGVMKCK